MTQEDFIFIIYESFDHLPALQSYLNKKRKDLKCIRREYAFGLTMAFKTINEAVNQRDYNHVMFTKPDGETIEYELNAEHFPEQIFHLQTTENLKGAKTSFPKKIVLDLRQITNGRFNGILTAAHMEHLWPLLDAYLQTIEQVIEPVHETSQPIQLEYIESYRTQMQKMGKEMFLSLMAEYNKKWNSLFFAYEIDLVNSQIRFTEDYITETENLQHQRITEVNGNVQVSKRLPDDNNLPGYKDYLKWLKNRKTELETNSLPQQLEQEKPEGKTAIGFLESGLNIISANKITINKNGFPIDEKGNFVHTMDDHGNYIIRSVGHENIIISITDKQQNRKAAKQIAEYLSENFGLNLRNELLISAKNDEAYTLEPARLPTIGIYINYISKTLNYLGSVYGLDFEYLIYIDFKEITNHTFIAAKTELYNSRALRKSVEFVKMWFIEQDKIYLQKRELFTGLQSKPVLNEARTPQQKNKLTINQIALLYVYQGNSITREKGNEIAKQYEHNSGEKLFQRYTFYSKTGNRKAIPTHCTAKTLKNKIELFESVIEILPDAKKQKAQDELNVLNQRYNSEYQ